MTMNDKHGTVRPYDPTLVDTDVTDEIDDAASVTRTIAMVTTIDNPYDYFTQFAEWNAYDVECGYNTCCYLARIVDYLGGTRDDMTEVEELALIEKAVDDIMLHNPLPIYKKITRQYSI